MSTLFNTTLPPDWNQAKLIWYSGGTDCVVVQARDVEYWTNTAIINKRPDWLAKYENGRVGIANPYQDDWLINDSFVWYPPHGVNRGGMWMYEGPQTELHGKIRIFNSDK